MANLENHLLMVKIPNKLFLELKNIDGGGNKGDSKQERMFGSVAKIPIANTFNELVEMDFVNYGYYAAFLHIQGAFRDLT